MTFEKPPEGSQTLGQFLRQRREKKGLTIEQVASATKISMRLLHSLEGDQYADLPAKPFIRGFVISYGRFIGLDPQELLTRFEGYISDRISERPLRDSGHSGYAFERRDGDQSRTMLWLVIGFFALFGGLTLIILKPTFKRHHRSSAERLREANTGTLTSVSTSPEVSSSAEAVSTTEAPPAASLAKAPGPVLVLAPSPTPIAAQTPVVKPVPTPTPTPTPVAGDPLNSGAGLEPKLIKHKLLIRALDDVRVRYRLDSRPPMTFILRKGRMLALRSESVARFQVSDASRITYHLNGAVAKPMMDSSNFSNPGGVPTLIFATSSKELGVDPFPGEGPVRAPDPPFIRSASPVNPQNP